MQLNLIHYAFVTTSAFIVNLLPLTPGGLGIGEAAFGEMARLFDPTPGMEGYATIFLVYRALGMVSALPGLLFFLTLPRIQQNSPENSPDPGS